MLTTLAARKQSAALRDRTLLTINGVSKYFGETRAVDDVSLEIRQGEIFALLGGSGSGKSTLLRILAGFEQPSTGSVQLDGVDITALPPNLRPVNMMFQSYALFPHMSVADNIAFGLKQDKLPKEEVQARVESMLKLVKMSKFAKRKPHQLSGGQMQRVALARSLAKQPKLLLLDEPMGALDKKLRTEMQLELVDIIEKVGVTCVMVTHDQEEAMTMADRIAIMDEGYIQQVGTPVDIYENPINRMVAEFVGSINLFECVLGDEAADHTILHSEALDRPIYVGHGFATDIDNREVTFAVRPEKTWLTTEAPEQDYNWEKGTVADFAYLGGHSIYYVELRSGQIVQCFLANTERKAERPTWDDEVFISWESDSGVIIR
ncbi:ABC transporter ATP-binding protein [Salinibius halmophilus]|uniref:ABC transporter ATP-binding protein n=1 Tax=Salinibius halmophilus TaxID=1853216 RepID=UPI000E672E2C|nr:polyamine ABC transporter ATP-binding protein [Salinibius halmophilus]